jgi:hypothetical protein
VVDLTLPLAALGAAVRALVLDPGARRLLGTRAA